MTEDEKEKRIEELRDRMDTLSGRIASIQDMERHSGWTFLRSIMEGQLRARRIESFQTELRSIDAVLQTVESRGHMAALQLHINLPKLALDDLEADLANVKAEIDELTGKEQSDG